MAKGMPNPFWLVTSTSMNQEIINLSSGSSERGEDRFVDETQFTLLPDDSESVDPPTMEASTIVMLEEVNSIGFPFWHPKETLVPLRSRKLENTVQCDDNSKVLSWMLDGTSPFADHSNKAPEKSTSRRRPSIDCSEIPGSV